MNKYSLPIALLSSASIFAYDPYDHMHAMIDSMRQMSDQMNRTFDEIHRHMDESFATMHHRIQDSNADWKLNFDETDDAVILKIKGIKTDSIDATLDEEKDMLRIKTDEGTIFVYSAGKALQVTVRQERKTETEDKIKVQSVSVSQSTMARTIDSEIDLEQANIDYHKEEKELSLGLGKKRRKSKAKSLPVTIK